MRDTLDGKRILYYEDRDCLVLKDEFFLLTMRGQGSTCRVYQAVKPGMPGTYSVKIYDLCPEEIPVRETIEVLSRIVAVHEAHGSNEIMHEMRCGYCCGVGPDGTPDRSQIARCQVFLGVVGETVRPCRFSFDEGAREENEFRLRGVLEEYRDLLINLSYIHEAGVLHWDIRAENIYTFSINDAGFRHAQLIDLDSAVPVEDILSGAQPVFSCSVSGRWYSDDDKAAYAVLVARRGRKYVFVLDLTAAARVLQYCLTGDLNPAHLSRVCARFPGGIGRALTDFFGRAFCRVLRPDGTEDHVASLTKRYLSAADMLEDVGAIIDALNGVVRTPRVRNIRLMTEWTQAHPAHPDGSSLWDETLFPSLSLSGADGAPDGSYPTLTSLIDDTEAHLCLTGPAGSGKSTLLAHAFAGLLFGDWRRARVSLYSLRGLADFRRHPAEPVTPEEVLEYLALSGREGSGRALADFLLRSRSRSRKGRFLFFLDDFDAFADEAGNAAGTSLCGAVNLLSQKYGIRWIMAARTQPACLVPDPDWREARLLPLPEGAAEAYAAPGILPSWQGEQPAPPAFMRTPRMAVLGRALGGRVSEAEWLRACLIAAVCGEETGPAAELAQKRLSHLFRIALTGGRVSDVEWTVAGQIVRAAREAVSGEASEDGSRRLVFTHPVWGGLFTAAGLAEAVLRWGADIEAGLRTSDAQKLLRVVLYAGQDADRRFGADCLRLCGQLLAPERAENRERLEAVLSRVTADGEADTALPRLLFTALTLGCPGARLNWSESLTRLPETSLRTPLLTSLHLPACVRRIPAHACDGAVSLTEVTAEDAGRLTEIGAWAFLGCARMERFPVPRGTRLRIGEGAFWGCSALAARPTAGGAVSAEAWAFRGCPRLPGEPDGSDPLDDAGALADLGAAHMERGRWQEAQTLLGEACRLYASAGDRAPLHDLTAAGVNLAAADRRLGSHAAASLLYDDLLARLEADRTGYPEKEGDVISLLINRASLHEGSGEYDRAEKTLLRALGAADGPAGDPFRFIILRNLALMAVRRDALPEARERLTEAISEAERVGTQTAGTTEYPKLFHTLGNVLCALGETDASAAAFDRAVRLLRAAGTGDPLTVQELAAVYGDASRLRHRMGQNDEARRLLFEGLRVTRLAAESDALRLAPMLFRMNHQMASLILDTDGATEEAAEYVREAVRLADACTNAPSLRQSFAGRAAELEKRLAELSAAR